jgi:3-hydroxybutyryl-CoA dehydrogenase
MVMARILAQLVSVAADAATAGVAAPEDIDTAMRLGTNYPGGPFEWADTLGVTRIQMVLDHLRWFYGEDRYRMAPAVRRAVFAGVPLRKQAARSG